MNPDILIICATDFEVSYFLKLCPCKLTRSTKTGLKIFSGKTCKKTYDQKASKTYDLIITGIGILNTAHALTAYLEHSSPALILQTGIAGVFKQTGLNIGDIAIATQEQYIHTKIQKNHIVKDPLQLSRIYSFEQKNG